MMQILTSDWQEMYLRASKAGVQYNIKAIV